MRDDPDDVPPLLHHHRYNYRPIIGRADYCWPEGRRLAIYLDVNHEAFSFGSGLGATLAPSKTTPDVMNSPGGIMATGLVPGD